MNIFVSSRGFAAIAAVLLFGAGSVKAQSTAELVAKGDAADQAFKPGEALKSYLPAEKKDPKDVELLLKIARQYRHLMTDAKGDDKKLEYGNTSLAYAKRAAALAPNDSDAQLSPAISYGKMLPFEGKSEQVATSPMIKAAADRALKLNPRNDSAWHVLGRWHQTYAAVTGVRRTIGEALYGKLPTCTNGDAVACFNKAIAINPKRLRHYVELGRTYAQMNDAANARKNLEKALAMSNTEKDDFEMKKAAKETLADLP